jgi:hypothetical protein
VSNINCKGNSEEHQWYQYCKNFQLNVAASTTYLLSYADSPSLASHTSTHTTISDAGHLLYSPSLTSAAQLLQHRVASPTATQNSCCYNEVKGNSIVSQPAWAGMGFVQAWSRLQAVTRLHRGAVAEVRSRPLEGLGAVVGASSRIACSA